MKCALTEMDTNACAHCRTVGGPSWIAKYNGTCGVCRGPIDIGDKVRWTIAGDQVQHAKHKA